MFKAIKRNFAKLAAALVTVVAGAALTACNGTGMDKPTGPETYINFVTFQSQSDEGTVFTFNREAFTPLVTLTSAQKFDPKGFMPKPGERLLLQYLLPNGREPYTSGPVTLTAYQQVINGKVEPGKAEDNRNWLSVGIQQPAIWVAGDYLNINLLASYVSSIKKLSLVVDETTLSDKMPTVYMMVIPDEDYVGTWKSVYASIDITEVWNNKYDGFVLRFNNETGANSLTFQRKEGIKPM